MTDELVYAFKQEGLEQLTHDPSSLKPYLAKIELVCWFLQCCQVTKEYAVDDELFEKMELISTDQDNRYGSIESATLHIDNNGRPEQLCVEVYRNGSFASIQVFWFSKRIFCFEEGLVYYVDAEKWRSLCHDFQTTESFLLFFLCQLCSRNDGNPIALEMSRRYSLSCSSLIPLTCFYDSVSLHQLTVMTGLEPHLPIKDLAKIVWLMINEGPSCEPWF
jgi:hypothetical protein